MLYRVTITKHVHADSQEDAIKQTESALGIDPAKTQGTADYEVEEVEGYKA